MAEPKFPFEYVTSMVSMPTGDGIGASVVNDSDATTEVRVVIYQHTGAGAVVLTDSGDSAVAATSSWSLGFTLAGSGDYWVRIQASSESLIPEATFSRYDGARWNAYVRYLPGDFAVYQLGRRRRW